MYASPTRLFPVTEGYCIMEDVANVHIFIFTCKFFLNFFDAKLFVYAHKEKAVSESLENHILKLFIWIGHCNQ